MGEMGAVRSDKRAANHNGEKGGQINEAKGIFRKVGGGASIEKISDTAGNGNRHAYCCGSGNGVTHFNAVVKHEGNRNSSASDTHKAG